MLLLLLLRLLRSRKATPRDALLISTASIAIAIA
jgi:hypothetical protein